MFSAASPFGRPTASGKQDSASAEPVSESRLGRREFVQRTAALTGASAIALGAFPQWSHADDVASPATTVPEAAEQKPTSELLVQTLYESLSPEQRKEVCFAWGHEDPQRGLLRTHVSNNWSITDVKRLNVGGEFFTEDQRDIIEALFFGLYNPDWHDRIRKQLKDDAGGYGKAQTIAIFGEPGTEQFEFVMTGRHLTIRCDGNTTPHLAFGGPVFYGHAADGFYEKKEHPGNVYWEQALKANELYAMLDGTQRMQALVTPMPQESEVGFQGKEGRFPGIAIKSLADDQKRLAQEVLKKLMDPYRLADQQEIVRALAAQGGLDGCSLSFYSKDKDGQSVDVGDDGVWDVWRIEGPSFVWHFRGEPHVHVWVNVADDPSPVLNARG